MSLRSLLQSGAETFASSHLANLLGRDGGGRGRLTEGVMQQILDRFDARVRTLTPAERAEMRRIITAVDQAQRLAARLDNPGAPNGPRPIKPGEVGRLPGTGNRGGDSYTYTVRIRTVDSAGDGRNSFLVVIHSDSLLSGAEVRAQAIAAVETGSAATRMSYRAGNPTQVIPSEVVIVSVYRGSVNA